MKTTGRTDEFKTELAKLKIADGDIILVRLLNRPTPRIDQINQIVRQIGDLFGGRNQVLCAPPGVDVHTLDADAMRRAGWVRATEVSKA